MKHVDDDELRKQLRKMQGIAKNFLTYLQQHPERMSLARRFVDYYQDRALLLVRKYQERKRQAGAQCSAAVEMGDQAAPG